MTFRVVDTGHWKWSTDKRTGELNERASERKDKAIRKLSLICFKAQLGAVVVVVVVVVTAAQGIKINDEEFKM